MVFILKLFLKTIINYRLIDNIYHIVYYAVDNKIKWFPHNIQHNPVYHTTVQAVVQHKWQ